MFEYLGKDIELHRSLTDYLYSHQIEGRFSDEDVLDIYNSWPQKAIYCTTADKTEWALNYIREKARTSNIFFKEAVEIDASIRRKQHNQLRKIKIK